MKKPILDSIVNASLRAQKLLAILLDPDKIEIRELKHLAKKIDILNAHFIFVGGSTVEKGLTEIFVEELKKHTNIPIVLFPGDASQITHKADALLFLSLLSGRNPEYLIEQQIKAVPLLKNSYLEIIPTGYILIDGGTQSSVLKVSNTKPIASKNIELIKNTAIAGMYKGKQLIYLEAGSGAKTPVNSEIIATVKKHLNIPLIIGGGIKTKAQLQAAFKSGADLVVIGTAFENNNNFLM